MVQVATLTD
jgi:hypothetical protein